MIGDGYIEGRSVITVSMEKLRWLVDRFAGTGNLGFDRKGKWKNIKVVDFLEEIGYTLSKDNDEKIYTTRVKIHYSKTGVHVVPNSKEDKR